MLTLVARKAAEQSSARFGEAPAPETLDAEERMSVDELRALQLTRLRETLHRAYANVPHYRRAFDAAGVHPDDCRDLSDLAKFPTTSKADLRENYPFGMFAVPQEQVRRIHASSGTTGQPTVVGYTARDIDNWAGLMARSLRAAGARPGHKVHNAYGYGLFTGGLGAHYGIERLGATAIPISGGMTPRQVQLINDFRPEIIMVTPSYMLTIVDEFEKQGLDPAASSLQVGVFGAEPWTEQMRAEIEERMDMHAVDIYGLSEVMGPGVSPGVRRVEGRPAHLGGPLLPGGRRPARRRAAARRRGGRAALHLAHQGGAADHPVPHARPHAPLPGSARPGMRRMQKITGRSDDMIILRGVNVFPTQIEEIVLRTRGPVAALPARAVDGGPDGRAHRARGGPPRDAPPTAAVPAAAELVAAVKQTVGVSVGCEVVDPETLERSVGKLKRLRDLRSR